MRRATSLPSAKDHPRSRGVYPEGATAAGRAGGSSPLARGLLIRWTASSGDSGIIPARAGFTRNGKDRAGEPMDHPRSRGVYGPGEGALLVDRGSSPLARGLPAAAGVEVLPAGIIPARAGFTGRAGRRLPRGADHPRSRGVYRARRLWVECTSGSSPLARGLLVPAAQEWFARRDHPRSRGVYAAARAEAAEAEGSSPLARGLRGLVILPEILAGIIPARAGFTLADRWYPNEPVVYQTPAAFTADLGPAPPGRDSAVEFGAALSTAGRAGRDSAAAGLRPWFGHPPDTHRRVVTTSG